MGGTGKTPHVELLIRLLKKDYRLAVLTRGYGRKTKGPIIAGDFETAETIGDEPMQIRRKFPDVMIYVDGNRKRALQRMEDMPEHIRPQVVLMDDGYQHRYVEPAFTILLTPYHRPYYEDSLLPYGELREPASRSDRADSLIVTHTPRDLTPMDIRVCLSNLDTYDYQDVYFSRVMYDHPRPIFPESGPQPLVRSSRVVTLSGLARPESFVAQCHKMFPNILDDLLYPDHAEYSSTTLQEMLDATEGREDTFFLTTEKDETKLLSMVSEIPLSVQKRLWVLPIKIDLSPESTRRLLEKAHKAITNNGLKIPSYPIYEGQDS